MLVLTRRAGEEVAIGGGIRVTVVAIDGNRVRLGVTAPDSVRVDRGEVRERRRGPDPGGLVPSLSTFLPEGETLMASVRQGDRVQVHFVKRFQDGSVVSSRDRGPLELTVGVDHPRLPGLGLALVGKEPGTSTTVAVAPEQAYGQPDPGRVYRLSRARFGGRQELTTGKWIRLTDSRGRRRLVRIVESNARVVVVDTNHPRAGQALTLEVELLAIRARNGAATLGDLASEPPARPRESGGEA